jgi:hypothetical protein
MNTSGFDLNFGKICIRLKDHAYCPVCEKLVRLVTTGDAAAIFRATTSEVEQMGITGQLHRLHNRRAKVMICTDSLFRHFDRMQTRRLDPDWVSDARSQTAAEMK